MRRNSPDALSSSEHRSDNGAISDSKPAILGETV